MAKKIGKTPEEWFRQAKYDLATAKAMFEAGRYIYTIFMYHLAIEKAMKGLYTKELKKIPPKTHDLLFLIASIKIELPGEQLSFLKMLNDVSVPTRYPDDLERLLKVYKKKKTQMILVNTEEILKWLERKL